jgi:tripartite-type tricarboxylate transporter receptor subunit TctC
MGDISRRGALAALGAATLARPALSQPPFPAQQIQLIVPFAAGGGTDLVARHYAAAAGRLGVSMQVVPLPGAGGARGTRQVAQAAPDGYNLLFGTMGSNVTTPMLNDVGYRPDSFDPIAIVGAPSFIFVVDSRSSIGSMQELVGEAKKRSLTYGSAGAGSSTHVALALFSRRVGIEMLHIPFNGSAEALTAVLGRHVDLALPTTGSGLPTIRQGAVRGLAITSSERSKEEPSIPTVKETGVDFTFYNWRGILAPKGTPKSVRDMLTDLSRRIVADPEFILHSTRAEGEPPTFLDGEAFQQQMLREVEEQVEITTLMRKQR